MSDKDINSTPVDSGTDEREDVSSEEKVVDILEKTLKDIKSTDAIKAVDLKMREPKDKVFAHLKYEEQLCSCLVRLVALRGDSYTLRKIAIYLIGVVFGGEIND